MIISKLLLEWYSFNKRLLPWRETQDPYKIWVSEIILQQTRVSQGTEYYLKFIKLFPNIKTLAESEEIEVLKAWEGLGYYSRARNLQFSSRIIQSKHAGIFPDNYKDIIELKGIGPYTAGAIASIAFNLPYPAIDGNVKRVISRIYGIRDNIGSSTTLKEIENIIRDIIDEKEPGKFNQALMDFGSLICMPKNPSCAECPLGAICYANTHKLVSELPVTYKKNKVRSRAFLYFLFTKKDKILIKKRTAEDIWKGLYEFPMIEYKSIPEESLWIIEMRKRYNLTDQDIKIINFSPNHKHLLSHQKIDACFVHVEIRGLKKFSDKHEYIITSIEDLETFPFPRLIQKYIQNYFH